MRALTSLSLAVAVLLVGCGRNPTFQSSATLILQQPEWGGFSGTAPVDQSAWKFRQTVIATVESPAFLQRMLRDSPTLKESVLRADVRYKPVISHIEIFVAAKTSEAALDAARLLAAAAVDLTSEESEKKYRIRVRLLDAPALAARQ